MHNVWISFHNATAAAGNVIASASAATLRPTNAHQQSSKLLFELLDHARE